MGNKKLNQYSRHIFNIIFILNLVRQWQKLVWKFVCSRVDLQTVMVSRMANSITDVCVNLKRYFVLKKLIIGF